MKMLPEEEVFRSHRMHSMWLAYLGWITALLVVTVLKILNYSQISYLQILILLLAATCTHIFGYVAVRMGWDRYVASFDPHFVFLPNWLFFAPLTAYGYYAVGDARDIMLVGWFMGLLFLAGHIRFKGVMLTASWYMTVNMAVLSFVHYRGGEPVDLFRESIRSAIFLIVCVFFAFHFRRFAAHKEHLKDSLTSLREKDRLITLLNQRLAKYVTTSVVDELAKEENLAILSHQRRKITVFFSDIQGFSVISDALEAEELAQLLNEYFGEMIHIVLQFGGTLDKLMGDGMMVVFGAPAAIEPPEGAMHCVQMACNMQERLTVLNDQWRSRGYPYPIKVRMGISTGVTTVGSFGSDVWLNYTAIGVPVNTAARLQQAAKPGEILLSHSTYSLVSDQVEADDLGETHLKGLHYPLSVYRFKRLVREDCPVKLQWEGKGYSICLQPQIVDIPNKEQLVRLLEANLGRCKKKKDD